MESFLELLHEGVYLFVGRNIETGGKCGIEGDLKEVVQVLGARFVREADLNLT
jgi:hypothetical protein